MWLKISVSAWVSIFQSRQCTTPSLRRFFPEGLTLNLDVLSGLGPAEPGTIRVGLVATFARWKGHSVFLNALSRLSASSRVRGYVIGGPIYKTTGSQHSIEALRLETARLGLAGRVGLTGFVDDTACAMRALDVVVHASTEPEPFGMVIVEGMACGKAVIASQAGGATEIFEQGVDAMAHPQEISNRWLSGLPDSHATRICDSDWEGQAEQRSKKSSTGSA